MKTLAFDPAGCFGERLGSPAATSDGVAFSLTKLLSPTELLSLEETRRQLVMQAATATAAGTADHLAAAPQHLLHDYNTTRPTSTLYQLLRTANRLRDQVDRVVVLAPTATRLAIQALMQACCDPFFNELSRGERGSRPRLYLDGDHWDNDIAQGLLRLLGVSPTATAIERPDVLERRWAVVVIDPATCEPRAHPQELPGRPPSPLGAAWERYAAALRSECREDVAAMAQRVTFVVGPQSPWNECTYALPGVERFLLAHQGTTPNTEQGVDQGAHQRDEFDSLFSVATLLPAAILGIDVVKLLHAAAAMQRCFEQSPVGSNPVLDYVATWEQLRRDGRAQGQRWLSASPSLRVLAEWTERLLGSTTSQEVEAVAATRIGLEQWRCDPLPVTLPVPLPVTLPGTNQPSGEPGGSAHLPRLAREAEQRELQRAREAGWPRAMLRMTRADEEGLGQFFQMLLLVRECQRLRAAQAVKDSAAGTC